MMFDYINSQSRLIYGENRFHKSIIFQVTKYLASLLWVLSLMIITINLGAANNNIITQICYLTFSILGFYLVIIAFDGSSFSLNMVSIKLSQAINNEKTNLADYLSNNLSEVMENCYQIAQKNQLAKITPELLIIGMTANLNSQWLLTRLGLIVDNDLKKMIIDSIEKADKPGTIILSDELIKLFEESAKLANQTQKLEIDVSHVLLNLVQMNKLTKEIIFQLKVDQNDIQRLTVWQEENKNLFIKKPFWELTNNNENLGENWVSGYTPILNNFAYNLSQYLVSSHKQYLSSSQNQAISDMENTLAKSGKNNVLLVGDAGTGKKTLVKDFIRRVYLGEVEESLKFKHIYQLDVASVLAGSKEIIEPRIIRILNEVAGAGNIILFIDGFADLAGGDAEQIGTIDATTIFMPYLSSGSIRIIGTCSDEDYKLKIEPNTSLKNSFETIKIAEPKPDEVLNMLLGEKILRIEFASNVFFSYQSLKKIVELTDRYIHDKPFPEKAIVIAEAVAACVKNQTSKLITPEIIEQVISQKSKIPVAEAKDEEKETLLDLEELLHQRIIGQDEAISVISNAMRRARAGLADKNRPMGSFLFLGPTGVGKTETAKALAEAYFKSDKNIVRFDMSEFQEAKSVELLIGSSSVSKDATSQGRLTNAIKDNPYSLILLDEIEKAHPNILNLLLQVLDEGKLTDSAGRTIDFSNTIIIVTSNAGAEQIRQGLKQGLDADELKKNILEYLQSQGIFKPEFLNRFDGVICFKSLTSDEINKIAELMISKLSVNLGDKGITLNIAPDALTELARLGYDPVMGARPMRRVIQDKIENMVAKKMLAGDIARGQTIEITTKDLNG
ncbi:MAG: clp protease ATP binding subunit [uncultured bacterium]|nr:MAG: clp protease ATP binding subunit [uncultured bacterium]